MVAGVEGQVLRGHPRGKLAGGIGAIGAALWLGAAAFRTVASPGPPPDAPVRVFLRDGSFVRARAMPEIQDDRVLLRLHPSGMLAVLPLARIDLEATARALERGRSAAPTEPARPLHGTVSGGAPPGAAPPVPLPPPAFPDDERRRLEAGYARRFTELSVLQERLGEELDALRSQRDGMERDLRRYFFDRQIAVGLARRLRRLEERLDAKTAQLEEVQRRLQALLNEAAAGGVRVRRLPARGGR